MRVEVTVSSKGQVTIPQEVRQRLGLQQGDKVEFVIENGVTILRPARSSENPFVAYAGALGSFNGVEAVNAWVRDARDDDATRHQADFPKLSLVGC